MYIKNNSNKHIDYKNIDRGSCEGYIITDMNEIYV